MALAKTRVGKTDVEVTAVSFGSSSLASMPGTYGYEVPEERARATVHAIFDGPANMLDTSNNYGLGESETRIGHVIRERGGIPDGFVLATKLDRDMDTRRLDAARARRSLEESLERLGVDRVQVLHLHDPEHCVELDDITREGGALDELFKMKEEGLCDAVGLAMGKIDMQFPIVRERPFDCIINHNRYTLLSREADALFSHCAERGIAVFNAAPYAGGVLAKGADTMKRITYQEASEAQLEPVRRFEALFAEHDVPPGAAALQFSMRDPRIASTIVGVSKPERVRETLDWASHPIGQTVWEALDAVEIEAGDPEANRVYNPT